MQVSRSGYYVWRNRGKSLRQRENERLIPIVRAAHKKSKGTYGARRIAAEVEAHGSLCGRAKAGTLMKLAGVVAKQKKKFKATTGSKHNLPVAPNLLNRQFEVKEPDRVYVSDITYIWTHEGWLYLAVVLDLSHARLWAGLSVTGCQEGWSRMPCVMARRRRPAQSDISLRQGASIAARIFRNC
jgi:hypothetical protein